MSKYQRHLISIFFLLSFSLNYNPIKMLNGDYTIVEYGLRKAADGH